jgi:lipoate-protein ligase B
VPCGIGDRGVTSLSDLLGQDVPIHEVESALSLQLATVFERAIDLAPART